MSDLAGKVVAITGAARGMGRAYTQGFLAQGARVVAMDQSWAPTGFSGDTDDAFRRELEARPADSLMVTVDISNEQEIEDAYRAAIDRFGTIDVLINNAGTRQRDLFPPTGRTTILETRDSDWERMFNVTVFGTLRVTRHFIQPMLSKQQGSVVSVVSSGVLHHSHGGAYMALRPDSREMPYQSAKAALLTMMSYMADEVRDRNVAVNTLVPGHTRTTGSDEQTAARRAVDGRDGPVSLRPEHVVPLALFLAQHDARSGLTGRCFDAATWNIEHGLGGPVEWADSEAQAAAEAAMNGPGRALDPRGL